MKKFTVLAASLLIIMSSYCQDESEKKFTFSIRTGIAFPFEGLDYGLFPELGIQGEYRISDHFSVYMPIQLHAIIGGYGVGLGTLGLLAGPRYYVNDKFFAGIGAGYAYYLDSYIEEGSFTYQPHIGLNLEKTQWTLGYYSGVADYDAGFIELKAAFKIGRRD